MTDLDKEGEKMKDEGQNGFSKIMTPIIKEEEKIMEKVVTAFQASDKFMDIINFPKIQSPFVRKTIEGKYVVTPEITEGFEWVFEDPSVLAVDKLHGTNICCVFDNGILQSFDNRTNRLIAQPCISANWKTETQRAVEGVIQAMKRGWVEKFFTGRMYGELVGPTINGNLHYLATHYFVPFDYLKKSCKWNSWSANKYPKTFESIKEWMKELPSLFTKRMHVKQRSEDCTFMLGEGLVFHHPDGRMAKLRRNMFEEYTE